MNMLNNITIGTDPELFIWDRKNNRVISSIGLIPGEKGNAYVPEGFEKGFGLQIDNILGEFNIPPVKTEKDFVDHINKMKDYIKDFVQQINPDLTIKCSASEFVDDDQLQSDEAKLFGCSPDYNVYTRSVNQAPEGNKTNLRTTGMHIHVGYPDKTIDQSELIIKYLDMYLGIPSVLLDKDTRRRELYGKAGCFRITPHGVEYRVISGYFLKNDDTIKFVWKQIQKALEAWVNGAPLLNSDKVVSIINNGDADEAVKVCELYKILN